MEIDNSRQGRSIEENIDTLMEELKLAIQWGRPSILLVVYKSKFGLTKLQKTLELKLNELGQNSIHIEPDRDQINFLPSVLDHPNRQKVVFFVSNLERGGTEAYQLLNLHRESLIENQIRVVFWLTPNEAARLPHQAPDFWAFRHRVVEFSRRQAPRKFRLPCGLLIWQAQDTRDSSYNLNEQIKARESLLAELPARAESTSARVELLSNLGYLYWASGDLSRAVNVIKEGLRLARSREINALEATLVNGLGIISYESGKYSEAVEAFQKALEKNPQYPAALMNLSIAYCALGQKEKAVSLSKRAIDMDPKNARLWHSLGYIYDSLGRSDEAEACLKQAAELAPANLDYHESLAIHYSDEEDQEQAIRQINLAREHAHGSDANLHIIEEAIAGNVEEAMKLLKEALQTSQLSKLDAERSPILNKLFDLSQIGGSSQEK